MASVNKAIIIGNLGANPEVRHMPNGDAATTISVATTEQWKDRESGEKQERTDWHRVVFFRRLAEIVGEYLRKGSQVYIEGEMRTRKWTDKDGSDRYITEIYARDMRMLGSKREEIPQAGAPQSNNKPAARQAGGFDDMDDDIPF